MTSLVERNFWLVIATAAVAGLVVPGVDGLATRYLMPNLRYLIMSLLLMVLLRIDILEMLTQLKDVRFLAYSSVAFLVISPAILYLLARPLGEAVAVGVLIVSATPTGAASATIADLIGGSATLAASMVVLTSLLAPFTMPLMVGALTGASVDVDRLSLFTSLAATLFIPALVSQVVLRWLAGVAAYLKPRASAVNVVTLFFVSLTPVAANRELLIDEPRRLLGQTAALYAAFVLLHLVGYFLAPTRSREDRLALAAARAYMNLALAILIAASHFDREVLAVVVLAELPWSTLAKPLEVVGHRLSGGATTAQRDLA